MARAPGGSRSAKQPRVSPARNRGPGLAKVLQPPDLLGAERCGPVTSPTAEATPVTPAAAMVSGKPRAPRPCPGPLDQRPGSPRSAPPTRGSARTSRRRGPRGSPRAQQAQPGHQARPPGNDGARRGRPPPCAGGRRPPRAGPEDPGRAPTGRTRCRPASSPESLPPMCRPTLAPLERLHEGPAPTADSAAASRRARSCSRAITAALVRARWLRRSVRFRARTSHRGRPPVPCGFAHRGAALVDWARTCPSRRTEQGCSAARSGPPSRITRTTGLSTGGASLLPDQRSRPRPGPPGPAPRLGATADETLLGGPGVS